MMNFEELCDIAKKAEENGVRETIDSECLTREISLVERGIIISLVAIYRKYKHSAQSSTDRITALQEQREVKEVWKKVCANEG